MGEMLLFLRQTPCNRLFVLMGEHTQLGSQKLNGKGATSSRTKSSNSKGREDLLEPKGMVLKIDQRGR